MPFRSQRNLTCTVKPKHRGTKTLKFLTGIAKHSWCERQRYRATFNFHRATSKTNPLYIICLGGEKHLIQATLLRHPVVNAPLDI